MSAWPALMSTSDRLHVESLDLDAQGIAHNTEGKVVFIEGALPFESVTANINRKKNNWEQATLIRIHQESSQRVTPVCPHFGLHRGACGGCKMQHLHGNAQVAVKQRALEDDLWHLGRVKPELILRPIQGPTWGYRDRARLSVRHVRQKDTVLIGFRERKSSFVADMQQCPILPARVSAMLLPLRLLIASLDANDTCPQIEVACGDDVIALVLRHLMPLSGGDLNKLRAFAHEHESVQWWLQPQGPQTIHLLDNDDARSLRYTLPEFGLTLPFMPTDFTQVNPHINQVLVSMAVRLLAIESHERVMDWFCGLGNFTLPIATLARQVFGVEGCETLVHRARQNFMENRAQTHVHHALAATSFIARNLFEMTPEVLQKDGVADKWLIDPPREGALALVRSLAGLYQQAIGDAHAWQLPKRIVYVSCNPATLARDAGLLVHQAGYLCSSAGIINMFPHTAHVESVAVFDRV